MQYSLRACACLYLLSTLASGARATIRYEISLSHPEQHLLHVTIAVPDVHEEVLLQMPTWNALYQIRDFSAHVQRVEAFAGKERLPLEKVDKQTWKVSGSGTITVRYATYWDEPGPFATQLNAEHAFINPAMVLMYIPERRKEPVQVLIGDVPEAWNVAGSALVSSESTKGRSVLEAENYDSLADAPVEVGKFEAFDAPGTNARIHVVVHGNGWKRKDIEDELSRICVYETAMMGETPFKEYTFLLHLGSAAGSGGGGGMEHANSTAISLRSPEGFANVAAHEFFHLWNVKRLHPASLDPVDYSKEQYTRALWFAEGVTSTYAAYTLVRTGLWTKEQFYEDLAEQITELESRPANRWQSAEQSSLDAWLEKYPLYNKPQFSVSYYTKGQVLGVLLDILIRSKTRDEKSLDDVFREMNKEFARKGIGYQDSQDIQKTAEEVTGSSLGDFFKPGVSGADPLPYGPVLALAGLSLKSIQRQRETAGFAASRAADGTMSVEEVDAEGAAARAGLRQGDIILSWNGAEPPRNMDRWIASQKKNSLLHLSVRREEDILAVEIRLTPLTESLFGIMEDPHATEMSRGIRNGLLHGTGQSVAPSVP